MIKIESSIRPFTITFLMLTLCSINVFSQVTKSQLDKFYKKNQTKELEFTFFNFYNQAKTEAFKLSGNDTLTKVSEIFNLIIPDVEKSEPLAYFYLPSYYPRIFIDNKEVTFTGNFLTKTKSDNFRPILYDYQTIKELLAFIGPSPYQNKIVVDYMKNKNKMKKSKIKKAERLIADFNNKSKFIGQFIYLPATWGSLDRSLVPYEILYMRFNDSLTEVEISYNFTWRGATEIYKYVAGNWELERKIIEWIH